MLESSLLKFEIQFRTTRTVCRNFHGRIPYIWFACVSAKRTSNTWKSPTLMSYYQYFFVFWLVDLLLDLLAKLNITWHITAVDHDLGKYVSNSVSVPYAQTETGSGRGGVPIPHSRSFVTRIPHPALFSSLSRIPFFPKKNTLKKTNFCKINM